MLRLWSMAAGGRSCFVERYVADFDLRAEAASTGLKTQELVGPGTDGVLLTAGVRAHRSIGSGAERVPVRA